MNNLLKYATLALALAGTAAGTSAQTQVNITTTSDNDTVLYTVTPMSALVGNTRGLKVDTLLTKGGKATINLPEDGARIGVAGPALLGNRIGAILVLPGEKINVAVTPSSFDVTGSELVESIMKFEAERNAGQARLMALQQQGVSRDSLMVEYNRFMTAADKYLPDNLDNAFGVYLLANASMAAREEFVDEIAEEVQEGALKPLYLNSLYAVDNYRTSQAAQESVKEGTPAPEFSLPDMEGKSVTLSSFRGKWVILDFWGAWCKWCIKGMPQLREFYAAHKKDIEVIGIDCQDTREQWLAAVKEHGMDWVQLVNDPAPGEKSVSSMYGVRGYPTKLLIDPKGIISIICVGEDPSFFDQVLSKMK